MEFFFDNTPSLYNIFFFYYMRQKFYDFYLVYIGLLTITNHFYSILVQKILIFILTSF